MSKISPPHLTLVSCAAREAPSGVSRDEELASIMDRLFSHGIFDETYFLSLALADVQAIMQLLRLGKVTPSLGRPGSTQVPPFVTDLTTACFMASSLMLALRIMGFEKKLQEALDKLNDPYRV